MVDAMQAQVTAGVVSEITRWSRENGGRRRAPRAIASNREGHFNIERPTPNAQRPRAETDREALLEIGRWALGVRCWALSPPRAFVHASPSFASERRVILMRLPCPHHCPCHLKFPESRWRKFAVNTRPRRWTRLSLPRSALSSRLPRDGGIRPSSWRWPSRRNANRRDRGP